MRNERGFVPRTVEVRSWIISEFVGWCDQTNRKLKDLRPEDIDGYFVNQPPGRWSRTTVAVAASALRGFLRYAERCGLCTVCLAASIGRPRLYRDESLPYAPDWADVQRMLADVDTDKPLDIRDRAILLLLAVYGLRSGEVAALRLDQIDWDNGTLRSIRSGRAPMMLTTVIDAYVAKQRSLGMRFESGDVVLRRFCRAIGNRDIGEVTTQALEEFLQGSGPLSATWMLRYRTLSGLYRFAISRGYATFSPLPTVLPKLPPPQTPYVYSKEELGRLLDATSILRVRNSHDVPAMYRTLLLLLYGSGMRIGEALRLTLRDVDVVEQVITINDTKFFKTRIVPIGPKLTQELVGHIERLRRLHPRLDDKSPFFSTRGIRPWQPPQCRGRDGHRSAGPSSRRLVDKIGINVLRPEIFKLPVGLVTPAQEFAYYSAPNLHCPRDEAALIAHPSPILVKYAVPNDVWF